MKFYFFHLMPYAALDLDYDQKHDAAWVTLPNSYYDPKIGHQLYNRYLDEIEYRRRGRLRRRLRQRAPPERLRHHADPQHHGGGARAPHQERQDRSARPCAAAAQQSAGGGRGIRHARQHHGRAAGRRLRARHRRGISFLRRQSGGIARALPGGARSHHPGVDPARSVSVRGQVLPPRIRQHLAALLPATASADLDPLAGIARDHRMGLASRPQVHLSADLQPGRGAGALHGDVSRMRRHDMAIPPRRSRSAGRSRCTRRRPTRSPIAKPSRISRRSSTNSCECRGRCCCRPAICRCSR